MEIKKVIYGKNGIYLIGNGSWKIEKFESLRVRKTRKDGVGKIRAEVRKVTIEVGKAEFKNLIEVRKIVGNWKVKPKLERYCYFFQFLFTLCFQLHRKFPIQ